MANPGLGNGEGTGKHDSLIEAGGSGRGLGDAGCGSDGSGSGLPGGKELAIWDGTVIAGESNRAPAMNPRASRVKIVFIRFISFWVGV